MLTLHNGSSGGAMPTFWPMMGVKVKSKKTYLLYYNIRFLCRFTRRHTQEALKGGLQLYTRVGGKGT
jgi:hypothetical protein